MTVIVPPLKELVRDDLYTHNGTLYRKGPCGYAFYLDNRGNWRLSACITNDELVSGRFGNPMTVEQKQAYFHET